MNLRDRVHQMCGALLHKEVSEKAFKSWMNSGLIGTVWRHFRTKNDYMIVGFSYCSTSDEWAIQYQRTDNLLPFTRPISNAFSTVNDATSELYGVWRFEQID